MNTPALSPVVGFATDPGNIRENNEDYYWITQDNSLTPEVAATKGYLYFVADGVGGHQSGEVASQMAAQVVSQTYYQDPNPDIGLSLRDAVAEANRRIYHQGISAPEQYGMGTTFTGIVLRGNEVYVANVGDSRTYLIRGGQVQQLSIDHTWVQEKLQAGILTPEEAANHPQKNVITRSLGGELQVAVDVFPPQPVAQGDVFLMCSDGLSDLVHAHEIAAVLAQHADLNAAAQQFVQIAKQRGAPDNVTVVLVSVGPRRGGAAVARPPAAPRAARRFPVVPVVGVILVLAAVLALIFSQSRGDSTTPRTPRPTRTPKAEVTKEIETLPPTDGEPQDVAAPTLTGPQADAEFSPDETISFIWEDTLPEGRYRYKVTVTASGGMAIGLPGDGVLGEYTVPFEVFLAGEKWAAGTYTWQVAVQQQDDSGWQSVATSEVRAFTVGAPAVAATAIIPTEKPTTVACTLQAPTALMPPKESSHLIGADVTFTWSGGSLCSGQQWQVVFDNTKLCNPTTGNAVTCQFPWRTPDLQYAWWVAVVDASGALQAEGASAPVTVWLKGTGSPVCQPPAGGCPEGQVWKQEQCECVR